MKLTNPPLVCCRRCGAVYAASFALSGGYDKPEHAAQCVEEAKQASSNEACEHFFLGVTCTTPTSDWDEINGTTVGSCGEFYWKFVEAP